MQKQKNKGKSRRSGDTDGNFHLARNLHFYPLSATLNTLGVLHAPTLARHAIRKTDIGRPSPLGDILSALSAN
jgi:hypothetical protein